jgi:putative Mg2+ transporter-C (MgtC) family protein
MIAGVAGGLIGLEREVRGRQAGFRTNLLVCVGSCLTMIVSLHFATHSWQPQTANQGVNINIDPARIAYGVMTGVGFLGAGTIIHHRGSVRGLTTAAAMWCVAAVGLAAGFGMYVVTAMAVGVVLVALWLLDRVEARLPKLRYRTITVRRPWGEGVIEQTVAFFKEHELDVTDVSFERTEDLLQVDVSLMVAFTNRDQYYACERRLEKTPGYDFMATREG